ncbi:collagen alpha-1(I) chain-like [Pseudopipra pipra]|uniref:collagen alpha-1(I) chain-like n=1 Tax=Pseudopipra pipra TaxID=415032 RepID=UPI00313A30E5
MAYPEYSPTRLLGTTPIFEKRNDGWKNAKSRQISQFGGSSASDVRALGINFFFFSLSLSLRNSRAGRAAARCRWGRRLRERCGAGGEEPPPRPPGPRRSAPAQRRGTAARDIPRHAPARGAPAPPLPFLLLLLLLLLLLGERLSAGVSDLPPPPPAAAPGRAGGGSAGGAHGRAAGLPRTRVGPAGRHSIPGSSAEPRPRRRAPAPCAAGASGGAGRGGGGGRLLLFRWVVWFWLVLVWFFFFFSPSPLLLLAARGGERSRIGASTSRLPQASSPAIHSRTRGRRRPRVSASPVERGVAGGLPLRSPPQHQGGNGVKLCRNSLAAPRCPRACPNDAAPAARAGSAASPWLRRPQRHRLRVRGPPAPPAALSALLRPVPSLPLYFAFKLQLLKAKPPLQKKKAAFPPTCP